MFLVITLIALAAALGFAVVAWRATRSERERSAARVALLRDAIDAIPPGPDAVTAVQPLFTGQPHVSTAAGPLLKVAGGFIVLVVLILAAAMAGDRSNDTPAASTGADPSLELLSMRHERQDDTLTVTGLVRNPGRSPADHITAVVFAFDRNGGFIASGRAPLDFPVLGAGDESPFRVAIPSIGDVGRYRVSFRTDAGMLRHLDRRGRGDSSSTATLTGDAAQPATVRQLEIAAQ